VVQSARLNQRQSDTKNAPKAVIPACPESFFSFNYPANTIPDKRE
jgi:hypothetical protein